jgi:uncharacterized flavoprotein (TIGR03862 family)
MTLSAAIHADRSVAIIGGGPAGLMAAEVLSQSGICVDLYDAMPSVGRKLLLAGIGGLNVTHNEAFDTFCSRFGVAQEALQVSLDHFTPEILRRWMSDLGIETFVGSSNRVFPKGMKAAPFLRAWLQRLRHQGVRFHVRHRWQGWRDNGSLELVGPHGITLIRADATLFALGGASWPKLGSNGAWVPLFRQQGIHPAPLQSANCGFEIAWSELFKQRFSGEPLKSVAIHFSDCTDQTHHRQGECIISREGIEGSLIYALSRPFRETINATGSATFNMDLSPDRTRENVLEVLCRRGRKSLSSHLKSAFGFNAVKTALLYERLSKDQITDLNLLASAIKALPVTLHATRPIAEAISTAGGICFQDIDSDFMVKNLPGNFVAGEMLDWEAPTGGYLLTACLATGQRAAHGILNWLTAQRPPSHLE